MKENKVSVVIPVYNSAKFLSESIESVLSQTYQNIEIIAIDDGSTDQSVEILEQYSDKIKFLTQPNQGLSVALNNALTQIHGKWFKWFSPDDILLPDSIEILVKTSKMLPENTIVYSNWKIIDETGKTVHDFLESNYNDLSSFDYNIRLLDGQQINVNTALIPSYVLVKEKIKILKDPVAIDYDFFLRCALFNNFNFHLIQKPLIKYRIHSEQLSHKHILETLSYISEIKNEILLQIDNPLRSKYILKLEQYKKEKTIKKKTMEFGLKLLSSTPDWVSDKILIFYLNKIRQNR